MTVFLSFVVCLILFSPKMMKGPRTDFLSIQIRGAAGQQVPFLFEPEREGF